MCAFTALERDPRGFFAHAAVVRADVAAQVGAITAEERTRWLAALEAEQRAERFVGGTSYLFAWGVR